MLFVCYAAAHLDRVNLGFATLQIQSDLAFSDTVYGIGAGVWVAHIMVSWAVISAAVAFANSTGERRRHTMIPMGNIGGAVATSLVGRLSDLTGSTAASLYAFGVLLVVGGLLVLALPRSVDDTRAPAPTGRMSA